MELRNCSKSAFLFPVVIDFQKAFDIEDQQIFDKSLKCRHAKSLLSVATIKIRYGYIYMSIRTLFSGWNSTTDIMHKKPKSGDYFKSTWFLLPKLDNNALIFRHLYKIMTSMQTFFA